MIIAAHHLAEPEETRYQPKYDWPRGCEVQWGDLAARGLKRHYATEKMAFFEAFPTRPDTYLRGEGDTILESEEACWARWQRIVNCPNHDHMPKSLKYGHMRCTGCGLVIYEGRSD